MKSQWRPARWEETRSTVHHGDVILEGPYPGLDQARMREQRAENDPAHVWRRNWQGQWAAASKGEQSRIRCLVESGAQEETGLLRDRLWGLLAVASPPWAGFESCHFWRMTVQALWPPGTPSLLLEAAEGAKLSQRPALAGRTVEENDWERVIL